MIIVKFGGSSLANAERIIRAAEIVKAQIKKKPAVVVSALGRSTDRLIEIANLSASGRNATSKALSLINWHNKTIAELGLGRKPDIIENEIDELIKLSGTSYPKSSAQMFLERFMSLGERMSSRIFAAYLLSTGVDSKAYDAYNLGMVTDSNFGNADILPEVYNRIYDSFKRVASLPVITGFIGKDKKGNITTLGRGGSDYTACTFGAALKADEIQIWTNVNGIMTADPKIVRNAHSVSEISYDEEAELEYLGAKTLHPKGILPAMQANVSVRVLNTLNPKDRGTLICKEIKEERRIVSITHKEEIDVILVNNLRALFSNDSLIKVLNTMNDYKLHADLVLTSKSGVLVTLNNGAEPEISKAAKELRSLGEVERSSNIAKISLVGKNITMIPSIYGRMLSAVDDMPIDAVSFGGSGTSLSFMTKQQNAEKAIRLLHKEFFGR